MMVHLSNSSLNTGFLRVWSLDEKKMEHLANLGFLDLIDGVMKCCEGERT